MEISAGIQASLAGRYASALFDLASDKGTVTAVESDLEKIEAALADSSDLRAVTTNPKVSRSETEKALGAVGKLLKLSDLTQNFLSSTISSNFKNCSTLESFNVSFNLLGGITQVLIFGVVR